MLSIKLNKEILTIPLGTLTIVVLVVVSYLLTGVESVLIFRRENIIAGEMWRLLTGHSIHFTSAHLLTDLLAFIAIGSYLEIKNGLKQFFIIVLNLGFLISLCLLLFVDSMYSYGGLSGINYGLLTYALMRFLLMAYKGSILTKECLLPVLMLILIIGRILLQSIQEVNEEPVFHNDIMLKVAWQAHLSGLVLGIILSSMHLGKSNWRLWIKRREYAAK